MTKFLNASALVVALLVGGLAANAVGQIIITPRVIGNSGTGAATRIAVWDDADNLGGDANLLWTGTLLDLTGLVSFQAGTQTDGDNRALLSTITWNAGADTFKAWDLQVTDTASAAGSLLLDLQVGGVSQFQVIKDGDVRWPDDVAIGGPSGQWRITDSGNGFLELRGNSTNDYTIRIANLALDFQTHAVGGSTADDIFTDTLNTRTAGQLFGMRNNGTSVWHVTFDGHMRAGDATNANLFIGNGAGETGAAITGDNNTGIGIDVLTNIDATGAFRNTALGTDAGDAVTTGDDNTLLGYNAGSALTTNNQVTAIGSQAGALLTSGANSTFLGYQAGAALTTGGDNVMIGTNAGLVATGDENTIIGSEAADAATTATGNVVIGQAAVGIGVFTGNNNVVIGRGAGEDLTSAAENVFIGDSAGANVTTGGAAGGDHVLVGFGAGDAMTTAQQNTFIGHNAGGALVTGNNNVALGFGAFASATDDGQTTAVGASALAATTVSGNTAVGYLAGQNLSTGTNNVFVGFQAGSGASTQTENTLVGYNAGVNLTTGIGRNVMVGHRSGLVATTAQENVFLGDHAGDEITTGDFNIFIGSDAGSTTDTRASSIAIGHQALTTADRQAVIGSADASGFLTEMYVGQGVTRVTPTTFTMNATGGSGTNNAAADWIIAGGRGTGTGAGGHIRFQTAAAGGAGASLNALADRMSIDDANGDVLINNLAGGDGSSFVCVDASGNLFTQEAAC